MAEGRSAGRRAPAPSELARSTLARRDARAPADTMPAHLRLRLVSPPGYPTAIREARQRVRYPSTSD
jgi:hypothetical protein